MLSTAYAKYAVLRQEQDVKDEHEEAPFLVHVDIAKTPVFRWIGN